ncbi:hypothetical protein [Haloarchaeobius sp. TZWWS8]
MKLQKPATAEKRAICDGLDRGVPALDDESWNWLTNEIRTVEPVHE